MATVKTILKVLAHLRRYNDICSLAVVVA